MHYYVDGYNLLFRLLGGASKNLKEERKQLITNLEAKADFLSLDISLVFDAQYRPGEESRFHFYALEIIYTPEKMTADEFILNTISRKKNLRQITVVTSDKILAWHARRLGVHTEGVEEFFSSINSRYKKRKNTKTSAAKLKKSTILASEISQEITVQNPKLVALEGSLDYYLDIFEQGFQKIQTEKKEKKLSSSPFLKKKRIVKKVIQEDRFVGLNEADRWLKIFEERVKEQK